MQALSDLVDALRPVKYAVTKLSGRKNTLITADIIFVTLIKELGKLAENGCAYINELKCSVERFLQGRPSHLVELMKYLTKSRQHTS
jgi:hypothetical protein